MHTEVPLQIIALFLFVVIYILNLLTDIRNANAKTLVNSKKSTWDITTKYNNSYLCRKILPQLDEINDNDKKQEIQLQYMKLVEEVICLQPQLVKLVNFLSPEECQHIIDIGQQIGLARSTVSEAALETADRTSQTVWLDRDLSFVIDHVVRRIADAVGIDHKKLYLNSSAESLQLVHYGIGELYKQHHDYGTDRPNGRFFNFFNVFK